MKLFAINDYEVWMGPSKEAVLEGLKSEYVELEDLVFEDGVKELSDEALDRLMFNDSDDRDYTGFHHWQCECGAWRTLVAGGMVRLTSILTLTLLGTCS
ncbi:hypothetical protein [Verrucomicrobium spinosum]|uniref:hypothetical protein n=1 Tax=Verrucomicrobium spinosum TaxID=2736 RepID=UPI0009463B05|nr:hypothetical protein [Verrucomicrobium spinosum]